MNFNNLHAEIQCNCLENATEDSENIYALKTMKNELRVNDFVSYWEKGRRPESENCDDICSLKGVSVSIFNDNIQGEIINIYKELFPLAPKYKPYLSVIKFNNEAGMLKSTPTIVNKHHYDFYKCDNFDLNTVNLITVKELHNV